MPMPCAETWHTYSILPIMKSHALACMKWVHHNSFALLLRITHEKVGRSRLGYEREVRGGRVTQKLAEG